MPSTKHTFFHVTVQDHNETNHHFLVPRLSDQADNDPIKVSAFGLGCDPGFQKVPDDPRRLTNTFYLPDKAAKTDSPSPQPRRKLKNRDRGRRNEANPPSVSIGFTAAMRPVAYAECVSVTDAPPVHDTSVVTFCDFEVDARYKTSVNIGPGHSPVWFQSRVVCHQTTSKKNFKSSVDYVPRMKPLKFEETNYVRPKHLAMTYVSYFDYNANDSQKWYTTSVEMVPSTSSHNVIHNFKLDRKVSSESDDEDQSQKVAIIHGATEDDIDVDDEEALKRVGGDINMNIVNKSVADQTTPQPITMISSGPEHDKEQRFGSTYMSHRTKMVVGGGGSAPSQRMNPDDYLVYLQGFASAGDVEVIHHGFANDVTNGYLSNDISEV